MTKDKIPPDVLLREEIGKRMASEDREARHATVAAALDETLVELMSAMIRASKSCSCSKGMRRHLVALVERFGRIREEALDGRNCFDIPPAPEEQGQ